MASIYTVAYRRKRKGLTDYKKRMKTLLGSKPRIVVRKSLKNFTIQIIEFKPTGDKIIASASTKELAKHGWKASGSSTPAAYLTGYLLAKKAKKKITCVLDIGQYTSVKGATLYAAALGAIEGGLDLNCSKEVIPDAKRIKGEHIAQYAKQLKSNKEQYEKQFSKYIKNGLDPEKLPEHFEQVKKNIGAQ